MLLLGLSSFVLLPILFCAEAINELDVKLGGEMATSSGGTIKILFEGKYHYICSKFFEAATARVICRQMSFPSGTQRSDFGDLGPDVTIMPRPILCQGYESSLTECTIDKSRLIYEKDCEGGFSAGVECNLPESGKIRLIGGNSKTTGTLEIWQHDDWGSIDDTGWDDLDARVACRDLGFDNGGYARYQSEYGASTGSVWMGRVECTGSETRLIYCAWDSPPADANHTTNAGVECLPPTTPAPADYSVRLLEDDLVYVYKDGQWGLLCTPEAHIFVVPTAEIICRQLGLQGGTSYTSTHVPEANEHTWQAYCSGLESGLIECAVESGCPHNTAMPVQCIFTQSTKVTTRRPTPTITVSDGSLRLVDGEQAGSDNGRVEVFYNEEWGTICDDEWDDEDASVVCKTLGLGSEGKATQSHTPGKGPIWLTEVKCQKDLLTFLECEGSRPSYTGRCSHDEDAGVDCREGSAESATLAMALGVASAFLLVLVLFVLWLIYVRHRKKQQRASAETCEETSYVDIAEMSRGGDLSRAQGRTQPIRRLSQGRHMSSSDSELRGSRRLAPSAPPLSARDDDAPPSYYDLADTSQSVVPKPAEMDKPPSYDSLFSPRPPDTNSSHV